MQLLRAAVAARGALCHDSRSVRALLILLVPLADLYLLVLAGRLLGAWPVLGFVLASAVVGGWLARREGRRVLRGFQEARDAGRAPPEGLLSAGLVAMAGLLMVLPGPVSTLGGIALLSPPVRRGLSRLAGRWFEARVLAGAARVRLDSRDPRNPGGPGARGSRPDRRDVVDVIDVASADESRDRRG